MQVLTISDEVQREIYNSGVAQRFPNVGLILACGDLPPSYLEFVVSMLNVPLLYVPGNHDYRPELTEAGTIVRQPEGCVSVDRRVVKVGGLSVAGLGGSPWYNGDGYQYTEAQMWLRVLKLAPRLLLRQYRDGHPIDFLITHAAPLGIHDGPSAHRGFACFRWLIDRFHPRFFIHGHVHPSYGYNRVTESEVGATKVINTVGHRLLEVQPVESQSGRQKGLAR